MKAAEKRELCSKRIKEQEKSSFSQTDWCNQEGIKIATLRYWRKKLLSESPAPENWVEIPNIREISAEETDCIRIECGHVSIYVPSHYHNCI